MKNKPFVILMVILALILSAYFLSTNNIPLENSILVKETKIYEYDK